MADRARMVLTPGFYYGLGDVQLDNVTMHAFPVAADKAKMQAWLDETFAAPSGGAIRYEAILPTLFLSVAEIGKQYMLDPADRDKGWTSEVDSFLWIPARREHDGLFSYRSIPVYLFVDTGIALAAGREVWGFPKQLGRFAFDPPAAPPAASRAFTAEAFVTSPFMAETQTRWAPVFELKPVRAASSGGTINSIEELVREVLFELGDEFELFAGELALALGATGITMSMLREFADASTPSFAAYQGILEAKSVITKMRAMGLTNDFYQLRVTSYDSHPFLNQLGVAEGWRDAGRGLWIDYDFTQYLATEVWRAN